MPYLVLIGPIIGKEEYIGFRLVLTCLICRIKLQNKTKIQANVFPACRSFETSNDIDQRLFLIIEYPHNDELLFD